MLFEVKSLSETVNVTVLGFVLVAVLGRRGGGGERCKRTNCSSRFHLAKTVTVTCTIIMKH